MGDVIVWMIVIGHYFYQCNQSFNGLVCVIDLMNDCVAYCNWSPWFTSQSFYELVYVMTTIGDFVYHCIGRWMDILVYHSRRLLSIGLCITIRTCSITDCLVECISCYNSNYEVLALTILDVKEQCLLPATAMRHDI